MLIIVDNASELIKKFEKTLKNKKIKFKVIRAGQRADLTKIRNIKGIILSGGYLGPYDKSITNDFVALMNFKVPVIGFCLGHEIIAIAFGGTIEQLPHRQYKVQEVIIDNLKNPIFKGLKKKIYLREKHYNHVNRLPKDFKIIAHSIICPIEVMKHKKKKIYGFQSHPEVSGEEGYIIMKNFCNMCGINL